MMGAHQLVSGGKRLIIIDGDAVCIDGNSAVSVALGRSGTLELMRFLVEEAYGEVDVKVRYIIARLKEVEERVNDVVGVLEGGVFDSVAEAVKDTVARLREIKDLTAEREELLKRLDTLRRYQDALRTIIAAHDAVLKALRGGSAG